MPDPSPAEETLARIAAIQARLAHWDTELRAAVRRARADGYTWREIGRALDVSSKAASMRFGDSKG